MPARPPTHSSGYVDGRLCTTCACSVTSTTQFLSVAFQSSSSYSVLSSPIAYYIASVTTTTTATLIIVGWLRCWRQPRTTPLNVLLFLPGLSSGFAFLFLPPMTSRFIPRRLGFATVAHLSAYRLHFYSGFRGAGPLRDRTAIYAWSLRQSVCNSGVIL